MNTVPATRKNVEKFLEELEACRTPSEFSACTRAWNFVPSRALSTLDPLSAEFREFQLAQYREISGRDNYEPWRDEKDPVLSVFDDFTVYPFTTQDPVCAGSYLVGVGLALRAAQIPKGGTIVEYGIGWGHTTLALAQLGYKVVAVDIEDKFLRLIDARAARVGLHVTTHRGVFGDLPENVDSVDAFLFFECFHHCLDHIKIVGQLSRKLNAGGRLILAGEPLFDDSWFYPWGLRLDGQSVWAIATHGWMELGFKRSYLESLLTSNGLALERHYHPEFGCVGEVYVGIKKASETRQIR